MQQVQQKAKHVDNLFNLFFLFFLNPPEQFIVPLFCRLCAPSTLYVFARGRSSWLRVCRGSHRCEYLVTEVSKGKVRVFSCLVRSL